jgi:hypothetical protein
MPRLDMCSRGLLLGTLLVLTGCASRPAVPVECPSFVPSPAALTPISGTDWKTPAERLLEFYTRPSQHLKEAPK